MSRPAEHAPVWSAAILSLLLAAPAGAVPMVRIPSADQPFWATPSRAAPEFLRMETLPLNPGLTTTMTDVGGASGGDPVPPRAPTGPGKLDSSKTFLAALPGAEITLLELTECPGSTCDTVQILFGDEEPAMLTSRIEGLVKFRAPAADNNSADTGSGPERWLEWLDELTEAKNDAGFPSLVLGAFGVFGIWLARLKRPRHM